MCQEDRHGIRGKPTPTCGGVGGDIAEGPEQLGHSKTSKQKNSQQFKGHLDYSKRKIHLLTLQLLPEDQGTAGALSRVKGSEEHHQVPS